MTIALDELRTRLVELEGTLAFIALASRLRPRLGDVVNWTSTGDVTRLAQEFMDAKEFRPDGLYALLLVRLVAALERYCRRLMTEALESQTRKAPNYDQLAVHVRNRNVALTGSLLATIDSPRDHFPLRVGELIVNLASCIPGATAYKLNSDAFAAAVTGAGPEGFEKALSNVGITNWWDRVGSDVALRTFLGSAGTRATAKAAQDRLAELWRWRNGLAHAGDDEIILTEEELATCIAFVRHFAEALDTIALKHE